MQTSPKVDEGHLFHSHLSRHLSRREYEGMSRDNVIARSDQNRIGLIPVSCVHAGTWAMCSMRVGARAGGRGISI